VNSPSIVSFFVSVCLASALAGEPVNIQILSATVKDRSVPDAEVILQKEGATSIKAKTDAGGKAQLPGSLGIDDEKVTLIIKKAGFSPLIAKCPCDNMAYAISETMTQLDGLRVVLNWGDKPADLDLHAVYPGNNVFFGHKEGTQAFLDVDDTDAFGPETVTLQKKLANRKYVFAVHLYSQTAAAMLGKSRAKVFVYIGQTLVRSFYVPAGQTGTLWAVFGIDELGAFHDINKVIDVGTGSQGSDAAATFMDGLIKQPDFGPAALVNAQSDQLARDYNKRGESAYHAGDLEGSIDLYRQAIELNPNFSQAYSNMGLSYMKLNRRAEVIWASRKAIDLASGANTATVRASSYYNIAKQYESESMWQEAKENYEMAQQSKANPTYAKSIERMKGKLGASR
jgi:hypothetical protein